eukprot:15660374-Heterocapsa_arctica.AAC.1
MNDKQDKRKVEIYYTLMGQKECNIVTVLCGYIMFEDPKNKGCATIKMAKLKLAERDGKSLSIKGHIVEKIMAMGLSWHLKIKLQMA